MMKNQLCTLVCILLAFLLTNPGGSVWLVAANPQTDETTSTSTSVPPTTIIPTEIVTATTTTPEAENPIEVTTSAVDHDTSVDTGDNQSQHRPEQTTVLVGGQNSTHVVPTAVVPVTVAPGPVTVTRTETFTPWVPDPLPVAAENSTTTEVVVPTWYDDLNGETRLHCSPLLLSSTVIGLGLLLTQVIN